MTREFTFGDTPWDVAVRVPRRPGLSPLDCQPAATDAAQHGTLSACDRRRGARRCRRHSCRPRRSPSGAST